MTQKPSSAIRAIGAPGNKSGQHILRRIVHSIDNLRLRGFAVELHKVPAHVGIDGNEAADKSAKEATGWRLKNLRRGKTREEDNPSTATKAQLVKKLISAKKTQLPWKNGNGNRQQRLEVVRYTN